MTTDRFKFILYLVLGNPDDNKSGYAFAKEHGVTEEELEEFREIQIKAITEYKENKRK